MDKGKKEASLCPHFKKCGSCQLLSMSYEEQLKWKQKQVSKLLSGFCKVNPIAGMEEPWHYRNKVHAVVDRDRKGNLITGIYEENSHRVVAVDSCLIEDEKADELIVTIRKLAQSFKMKSYDEDTGYGFLRHILIRRGDTSGQTMVVLVTASPVFPSKNNFVKALLQKNPDITTIVQNINLRGTSMVLGNRNVVMYGKGYIEDCLLGYTFRISPDSFYQVNPRQTQVLYRQAIQAAKLTGKETVIDAYCGIGTIGICASAFAKEVIGVELNANAVRDAIANAKRNKVGNVKFYQGDAGDFMRKMAAQGGKVDVVMMDPPRSGSTETFMEAVAEMAPEKVVYISCNPETQARDLRYFKKKGYQAREAWPVDMFPGTGHVETVALMSRKDI